jgi:hypothetical protein
MDKEAPSREKPLSESEEPRCTKSKTEIDDPRRAIPYTDIALPIRLKLHSEKDDPRCKKSITDSEDPKLVIP